MAQPVVKVDNIEFYERQGHSLDYPREAKLAS